MPTQNQPESNKSSQDIRGQTIAGLRWIGMSQVLQQILNLATSIVLARLLVPDDFGLLAMASVFTGIVYFVLDLGLGAALVQRQHITERQISSVFWINIGVGIAMTLVGIALSQPIAIFYNQPAVQPTIALLACNFLLFSLGTTQAALLRRQMNFRALELRMLVGQLCGTALAIAMAYWGLGIWSLVGRLSMAAAVETTMLWTASSWRPSWKFCWAEVSELIGFSNDVFAANLLGYVGRNADNLLIGRFVGVTDLGYYAMAYNLMMFPVQRLSQVLSGVLFPAFSRFQDEREKIERSWLRATRLLSSITIPLMMGLIALAPQFVQVVYGQKWLPAVPVLQILAFSGINQSLLQLNATVLLSLGKTRLRLKLTVLTVFLALISFAIGLPFGIIGVAACFTVANTATATLILVKTIECIGSSYTRYLHNIAGVVGAAGGMTVAVLVLVSNLQIEPSALLGLGVMLGGSIYLLLLRLLVPALLQEALSMLPERFTKRWLKFG